MAQGLIIEGNIKIKDRRKDVENRNKIIKIGITISNNKNWYRIRKIKIAFSQ